MTEAGSNPDGRVRAWSSSGLFWLVLLAVDVSGFVASGFCWGLVQVRREPSGFLVLGTALFLTALALAVVLVLLWPSSEGYGRSPAGTGVLIGFIIVLLVGAGASGAYLGHELQQLLVLMDRFVGTPSGCVPGTSIPVSIRL